MLSSSKLGKPLAGKRKSVMNDNENEGPPHSGRKPEPQEGPVSLPREAPRPAPGGDVHLGKEAGFGMDSSCLLALSTPSFASQAP